MATNFKQMASDILINVGGKDNLTEYSTHSESHRPTLRATYSII